MQLVLYSLAHDTCPIELREKLCLNAAQQRFFLKQMHAAPGIAEAVILNTCNRIEFFVYIKLKFDTAGFLERLFENQSHGSGRLWRKHCRKKVGYTAVRHLFRVVAGLDSQVIGESQILGQVKDAYRRSVDSGMSRLVFHRLFHMAFRAGKKVRTETNINCGAVSVTHAALELAKSTISLNDTKVLLVGAGKNAAVAVKYLQGTKVKEVVVANRSQVRARYLCGLLRIARPITLTQISSEIADTHLVISTTSADDLMLKYDHLAERIKNSILMIDIAVPRDIDPRLSQLENIQLFNIDQIFERINTNIDCRDAQIPKAEQIVDIMVSQFCKWLNSLDLVPIISNLTRYFSQLAQNEARRYARVTGDGAKLELFAQSLVKKILHGPISYLKDDDHCRPGPEQLQAIDLIKKMFLKQTEK